MPKKEKKETIKPGLFKKPYSHFSTTAEKNLDTLKDKQANTMGKYKPGKAAHLNLRQRGTGRH